MRAVLLDTGPLYALVIPSDQYHGRASLEFQHLIREGFSIVVPYPILLEAYTLILRRTTVTVAHSWLEQVSDQSILVNPTDQDYRYAMHRLRLYHDQPLTLFDGVLAVLGERLGLPVWSYDHHLDILGATRWQSSP